MSEQAPTVVQYRVGGKNYPQTTIRNCKVCNSPYRSWIENQILYGYGWSMIARQLQAQDEENIINDRNISGHYYNGHMPNTVSVRRKIMEERQAALGRTPEFIEKTTTPILDPWSVTQIGMQMAFEKLQNGELELEAKDLIALTRLNVDIQERLAANTDEINKQTVFAILKAAQERMDPEAFEDFMREIEDSSVMETPALPTTTYEEEY